MAVHGTGGLIFVSPPEPGLVGKETQPRLQPHRRFLSGLPFSSTAFSALANVDLALDKGSALGLFRVLQSPALGLRGLQEKNSDWYLKQLLSDRQQKRQVKRTRVPPARVYAPIYITHCRFVYTYETFCFSVTFPPTYKLGL